MFGRNAVASPSDYVQDGSVLKLVGEPFYTIQGEGPLAGYPALFVRLHGCNLRCTFCDTKFDDPADRYWSVERICLDAGLPLAKAERPLFVITGGEPLLQNLGPLIDMIRITFGPNALVQVETAGTIEQKLPARVVKVISPKTPKLAMHITDPTHVFFKYVMRAGAIHPGDGLPVDATQANATRAQMLARPPMGFPREQVFVQPMDEYAPEKNAANLAACVASSLRHGWRLGIQLHKLVGVP